MGRTLIGKALREREKLLFITKYIVYVWQTPPQDSSPPFPHPPPDSMSASTETAPETVLIEEYESLRLRCERLERDKAWMEEAMRTVALGASPTLIARLRSLADRLDEEMSTSRVDPRSLEEYQHIMQIVSHEIRQVLDRL